MARPIKEGLDYFPLDVDIDQSDKVAMIEAIHGIEGFGIVIKLLMKIYKEGYFYEWSKREQILFSKRVNVDINTANKVVNDCINEGLFNAEIYKQYNILTSKGIQRRYLEATKRRKELEFKQPFFLLEANEVKSIIGSNKISIFLVDDNNNRINVNNNLVNENISTQRKGKERKEKESKELNGPAAANAFEFYQQNFGQIGGFIAEDLGQWIDDLSEELVVEAMKRALEQNKKSWGYIKSILKDWAHKNIGSLQDVEAADVEFNNRKGGANKNGEHGKGNEEFNEQWGKALKQRKHTGAEF
jgi:DnaD/phage-associated family protein